MSPQPSVNTAAAETGALVQISGLQKHFPIVRGLMRREVGRVRAVEDLTFSLKAGEVLGLVGESGSGKTTAGRSLLRLVEPTGGSIRFDGTEVTTLDTGTMRRFRRHMQMIFQDPYASLNPRKRVRSILGTAIDLHLPCSRSERDDRIASILEKVGLPADAMNRFPHEFSGGQRQRIGIARALSVEPRFVVADEPVSALDVSVQAQVINLLQDLRRDMNLAMLFISHDLSVVRYLSDRVMVMYLGRVMEILPVASLTRPRHPYTRALLSASPEPDPDQKRERILLKSDLPSPANPPSGCVFRTRCLHAAPACAAAVPALTELAPGHLAACDRLTELA
ncbi:ABC transporter ATP-binding protein [Novispirillum itersonii]|uniref:ABC transporter ATP-binding protein n=1 Tax=Novispirillum itersonii TaxID=189 RepID=UPI00036E2B92|nr:oligopeptide/dipeptide ABC transporter ATP-binding protein [Novispirillum itersonii]